MLKKTNKKKKKKLNIFFNIIGIISTIIALLFCIVLFMLNMLPLKYLIIIYILIFIFYFALLFFTLIRKIKIKIKVVCAVIFIIFDIIFGVGIKYISDTMNFVNIIDNKMHQKEEYYVMTLTDSDVDKIDNLENHNIGIYHTTNSDKALEKLKETISFNNIEFDDITEMLDSLEEKQISAILINGSIKNLIETEFEGLQEKVKEVYTFAISIEKKDDIVKVVDVTRKPFNIYIAGGDAYGVIGNVTNTDVNMVVTVDPVNKKLLLTSIPRDYYVNLVGLGEEAYDKLTHAGYYGIEESVGTIENLLDIDINYYVKVNFSTIEGVINSIGGVDVYSEYNFCTYGGPQVCYNVGRNHLNGYEALMYARERHAFSNGDVQRVKNQQQVLTAIINKATSSTVLITNYTNILDSVSSSFVTNIDTKSISRLVKMQINDMSSWNIESQNLVGSDLYTDQTYTFPGIELYVMKQDENSVKEAKNKIKQFVK